MEILGALLALVGGIVILVGSIWLIVLAFQESVLWGLGDLFVPFVALIFVISFWDRTAKPFLISLGGLVAIIAGSAMMGPGPQG
jgi:hypothetical protein